MVKSVEKAVKEVVEGKVQNVFLEFNTGATFEHEDVAGYSVNGDWVAVMDKKGTTHVYPARSVSYIKHFNKE
jgi:hypothetical protein